MQSDVSLDWTSFAPDSSDSDSVGDRGLGESAVWPAGGEVDTRAHLFWTVATVKDAGMLGQTDWDQRLRWDGPG